MLAKHCTNIGSMSRVCCSVIIYLPVDMQAQLVVGHMTIHTVLRAEANMHKGSLVIIDPYLLSL